MTPRSGWALHAFHLSLLRTASLLAPASLRAEWWQEWRAELWHVRRAPAHAGAGLSPAERELTAFCLGAFRDALCLRRHANRSAAAAVPIRGSAAQCLAGMAAVLAAGFLLALLFPGVRAANHSSRNPVNSGLILIRDERARSDSAATIPVEQFREWRFRRQRYFDGFAFYRISAESVSGPMVGESRWAVAHGSPNLFSMLGLPLRLFTPRLGEDANLPSVILSCAAFEREFGGNPQIGGSVLRIGQRNVAIAGVAPCGSWRLPGKADAWLFETDAGIASGTMGYVLAHLTDLGRSQMTGPSIQIAANDSDDSSDGLFGVSLDSDPRGPWDIYLFTMLLAFLALPAITSVSMSETSFSSHKPSWPRRLCRWSFLCAKIALLLPIAYYVPLDFAYWHALAYPSAPEYIQLILSFSICLFGMRWVLLDQRKRCPVCLRRVSNPAQVGDASRTFLSWNGTEMICLGGHTLLHVPGMPTSWFSTQRWMYLDTSWDFLFAGSGIQKAQP
jgi:hypothetical protein